MTSTQTAKGGHHIKTFWAIFTVVILAAIAGGIILYYAQGNVLQDQLNSITFLAKPHAPTVKHPTAK